jgi:transposase
MLSMPPQLRPRAGSVDQDRQIDGETLLRALVAHKRGEPRVCSMVRAPTPEDKDRRRICRERKVLIMERVQHVNRIKGLLFSQGASGCLRSLSPSYGGRFGTVASAQLSSASPL